MTAGSFAAVDLGASSGRVILGRVGPGTLELREVHRFPNEPVDLPDGLHWDAPRLYHEIEGGLRAAAAIEPGLLGVGIDSWGVDYGLVDETGGLVGLPFHYRDRRTASGVAAVHDVVPAAELYGRFGIQFQPFDTLYQLAAEPPDRLAAARHLLLMPDLFGGWLTGMFASEVTNASTTAMYDVDREAWASDLLDRLGLPARILPPSSRPGAPLGPILPGVAARTGLDPATIIGHVGSHDTASAIVGVPAEGDAFAYIACGTWGLVGLEIDVPIRTEASRAANFTNEAGVDGRVRYLRNVMGLWLLQESLRTWKLAGEPADLDALLAAAAVLPDGGPRIDPDDPAFLPPGDMPARIADACRRAGDVAPEGRPALVRCILDSLADAFARAVADAERLSGRTVRVVHLVGGGVRNQLLCRLTADACGRTVVAGPVEATAIGNLLVQARAHGLIDGDLESLRALIRATTELTRFEPAAAGHRRRG